MGKTKVLVETANKLVEKENGDVVFIDDSNQLMYDLKHDIRFINLSDFPQMSQEAFLGFIYGIMSQDYDIEGIFIDGLNYILKKNADELKTLFAALKPVSEKHGLDFYITINGKSGEAPDYVKEFSWILS
jgi:hypothetical protein